MQILRWLVIYLDTDRVLRAAVITHSIENAGVLPFGAEFERFGLDRFDRALAIVELPGGSDFVPDVIDPYRDAEAPIQFIDL